MWWAFPGLHLLRRRQLAQRLPTGPLRDFYACPPPQRSNALTDTTFAVLDFETTGLDPRHDHIISLGYVEIRQLAVRLDSAWHSLVATPRVLPENTTVVHKLTDDTVARGRHLEPVVAELLGKLSGKVLIAHQARIELGFLQRICNELYDAPLILPWLDTQELAQRHLRRQQLPMEKRTLRLFNLRARFGLPDYTAHNALYDAIGTAELFLALVFELNPRLDGRLGDLKPRWS
ncbi:MAG TPA: 3'-5' exonuclease [Gammaproteobacteria bacterium]|nr:3'-5' exonuclease [Gammaproteobacteria bacterium]